jgi:hypothetical protein
VNDTHRRAPTSPTLGNLATAFHEAPRTVPTKRPYSASSVLQAVDAHSDALAAAASSKIGRRSGAASQAGSVHRCHFCSIIAIALST